MKKAACAVLALLMILSLAACSKKPVTEEETTEAEVGNEIFSLYEAQSGESVTNQLYAVMSDGSVQTNNFSFTGGSVSPERIAAGFTGWTGLSFRIKSEINADAKNMNIDFRPESSFVTGDIPDELRGGFSFTDVTEMRQFMMDSLRKTIVENMGAYSIKFTVDGNDAEAFMANATAEKTSE